MALGSYLEHVEVVSLGKKSMWCTFPINAAPNSGKDAHNIGGTGYAFTAQLNLLLREINVIGGHLPVSRQREHVAWPLSHI